MSAVAARPFPRLSTLEREGARRIVRSLLRDGMDPAMVRRHMMEKRAVEMALPEIQALMPVALSAAAGTGCDAGRFDHRVGAALPRSAAVLDCPARGRIVGGWTAEENARLRHLHGEGADIRTMMEALNRSYGSIDNQRRKLGLRSHAKRKWSREDEARLAQMVAQGAARHAIAKALGRTPQSISHKLHLMQKEA